MSYKDSDPPDLIAGRIQFAVAPTPALLDPIRGNGLQPLTSLTADRLDVTPRVPSTREAGWPDQVFHGGLFLFAPVALARHAAALKGWLAEALRRRRGDRELPAGLDRLSTSDAMGMVIFGLKR